MQTRADIELLRDYAASGSEPAFETLVDRHLPLVYSAALRQVRDPHAAEEIAQAVFVLLSRKAAGLSSNTILTGWLFKTTRFVSLAHCRQNARRSHYEQEAQMQTATYTDPPNEFWVQIAPFLDEALSRLNEKDRQAILLRYFENKPLALVGKSLGIGEDGARMRVNRALEKLHHFFIKRGIATTTVIIAGGLSAHSVQAAPPLVAKSVTAAAVAKIATPPTMALADGAVKLMAWSTVKSVAIATISLLLALGAITAICELADKSIKGIPEGWSTLSGRNDQWTWSHGKIVAHSTSADSILASAKKYDDFTMFTVVGTPNREASIAFHMQDKDNGYLILFVPMGTAWSKENGSHVSLMKRVAGHEVTIARAFKGPGISTSAKKAELTVTTKGPQIDILLDGKPVIHARDTTFPSGSIGFRIYGDPGRPCDATFAKLKIE